MSRTIPFPRPLSFPDDPHEDPDLSEIEALQDLERRRTAAAQRELSPGVWGEFLRLSLKRFGFKVLLQESIDRAKRAWREGYDAEDKCYSRSNCPYESVPGQAMQRAAWMRGYNASARDRRPATE